MPFGIHQLFFFYIRYTQTAVASFGPVRHSECGQKPGGFTRLTPEVMGWVINITGIEYHGDIEITDSGKGHRISSSSVSLRYRA